MLIQRKKKNAYHSHEANKAYGEVNLGCQDAMLNQAACKDSSTLTTEAQHALHSHQWIKPD